MVNNERRKHDAASDGVERTEEEKLIVPTESPKLPEESYG